MTDIDEEKKKFLQGFAYKPKGCRVDPHLKAKCDANEHACPPHEQPKKRKSMLSDFFAWKDNQPPFKSDFDFFAEHYGMTPTKWAADVMLEMIRMQQHIVSIEKKLMEEENDE